jgi:nucleoside 2-deoxyribosyltransferase
MPQIAYKQGTFKTDDILSADFEVIRRCDMLIAGRWGPSKGVDMEIGYMIGQGRSIYVMWGCDSLIEECDAIREVYG